MVRPGCGCRSGLVFVTLSVAMRLGYQIIVDIDALGAPQGMAPRWPGGLIGGVLGKIVGMLWFKVARIAS